MGSTIGPKIKVIANGNKNYTLDEIQSLILKQYVNDINANYFDSSTIHLATAAGVVFENYINNEGKECNFWEFSRCKLRNNSHNLNICLLTTNVGSKHSDDRDSGYSLGTSSFAEKKSIPKQFVKSSNLNVANVSKESYKEASVNFRSFKYGKSQKFPKEMSKAVINSIIEIDIDDSDKYDNKQKKVNNFSKNEMGVKKFGSNNKIFSQLSPTSAKLTNNLIPKCSIEELRNTKETDNRFENIFAKSDQDFKRIGTNNKNNVSSLASPSFSLLTES